MTSPLPDISALGNAGGFPAQINVPDDGGGSAGEDQPIAILKQMIDLAKQYLEVEPDEEDKATMASKVLATLQTYLAKDQADRDQALGSKSTARILRKAG